MDSVIRKPNPHAHQRVQKTSAAHGFQDSVVFRGSVHGPRNASFSIIWTADITLPLIVYVHSHKLLQGPPKHTVQMIKAIPPRKVIIPPLSAIVFCGDMMHCGPGQKDFTGNELKKWTSDLLLRSHIYLGRQNVKIRDVDRSETVTLKIPDAIHSTPTTISVPPRNITGN